MRLAVRALLCVGVVEGLGVPSPQTRPVRRLAEFRSVVESAPPGSTPTAAVPKAAKDSESIDWLRSWYPVNVLATMDVSQRHSVQLLGIDLVAWNDGPVVDGEKQPGDWHVADDLSPPTGATPRGSPGLQSLLWPTPPPPVGRPGGTSYPVREADGLLFVFPYCGADAEQQAAQVPLPLIDELHDPRFEGRWKWKIPAGVRDFPCSWDAMVENTLDPAHFCSAHHGTLGNRYEDPKPYRMQVVRKRSLESGFAVEGELGRLEFKPPCLVKYMPNFAAMPFEGTLVIATYCVPTRPGWVRPLANVLLDNEATMGWTLAEQALSVFVNYPLPPWVGHILSSVVLHQDAGLLYGQSRTLRERGYNFARREPQLQPQQRPQPPQPQSAPAMAASGRSESDGSGSEGEIDSMSSSGSAGRTAGRSSLAVDVPYERLAFCPTPADRGVLAFREWLRVHGGDGIPWGCADELPPRGSEDIFDMWDAHTRHCSQCQRALGRLRLAKYVSVALLAASLLWLPYGEERTLAALALAALAAAVQRVGGMFYRYEYSHADEFGPLDWYLDLSGRRK